MPRGGTSRRWIKLHCEGIIHGSVTYQLTDAEQAVWVKLLALAGIVNRDGQISDNDGRPFPPEFIAHEIHTSLELLEETIRKCKEEGRITEDEHGLHITNWSVYQSEYSRQKPYRDAKRQGRHFDSMIGFIRVGKEKLKVYHEEGGEKYYIDAKGKKVYVEWNAKTRKYQAK
jgi:hypothetical protein